MKSGKKIQQIIIWSILSLAIGYCIYRDISYRISNKSYTIGKVRSKIPSNYISYEFVFNNDTIFNGHNRSQVKGLRRDQHWIVEVADREWGRSKMLFEIGPCDPSGFGGIWDKIEDVPCLLDTKNH